MQTQKLLHLSYNEVAYICNLTVQENVKKKKKSFFNHSLPPNSDLFFFFTSLSHALSAYPLTVNASSLSQDRLVGFKLVWHKSAWRLWVGGIQIAVGRWHGGFFRVHLFSCWLLIGMTYEKCNYLKSNPLLLIKLNNFPYAYIVETIYSRKLAHNFDFNITKYKFVYDHLPWLTKMVKTTYLVHLWVLLYILCHYLYFIYF